MTQQEIIKFFKGMGVPGTAIHFIKHWPAPTLFYNEFHTYVEGDIRTTVRNTLNHIYTIDGEIIKLLGVGIKHYIKGYWISGTGEQIPIKETSIQTSAKRIKCVPLIHYRITIKNGDIMNRTVFIHGL